MRAIVAKMPRHVELSPRGTIHVFGCAFGGRRAGLVIYSTDRRALNAKRCGHCLGGIK